MPRSGGTYTPPTNSWSPAVNGTLATTADWQSLLNDIVAALTQSVSKDGQTTMTGSLNMGGFNLTNVASAAITTITGATLTTPIINGGTINSPVINTPTGIVKGDVGLGNVDNTSDANKPVSTATQTALNGKQDLDADLTAIAGLASNGLIARTGSGTVAVRTLTAGSARVTVTNGDGVSGSPIIDVAATIGTGDVLGPVSAVDGAAAIFDGTTGKLLKSGPIAQALGSASLPSYTFSGDTNTGVWSPAADTWAVSTAGSERLRIDSSGNVGVGTAAPISGAGFTVGNDGAGGATVKYSFSTALTERASISMNATSAEMRFSAGYAGYGGQMRFFTNGTEKLQIETVTGNVLVTGSGGLGYGVGSGGTVTQATSKSTAVTLNKPSGVITMNNAALNASTTVTFTLTNSSIVNTDTLTLNVLDTVTSANYQVWAGVATGSATINVRNVSAGTLSEAVILEFNVHKGAAS